jgi:predicted dehydrogenase
MRGAQYAGHDYGANHTMDRRSFLMHSATGAAGLTLAGALPRSILGANAKLGIGVIGCGGRGNFLISQVLRQAVAHNVEIVALCDVWSVNLQKTAATVAARQGGRKPQLFARYRDLLAHPGVDAVIIATPDFAHTPILIDATKARKDVYCEKPMSTVLEQANEAVQLVHATGNIVQVGTQRRSDARHQAGARLIQSGVLGKVSEVEAAWHDAAPRWARDYSDVRREDVDWEQYLMYLPREPFRPERFRRWHFYKDFTLGTPALLGAHLIDVGLWFMDDPLPRSAVAHGGVYVWKDGREHADTMDCLLEYPKEFLLTYRTRLGNNAPTPEVMFFGSKGTFDTKSWTARGEGGGAGRMATPVTVPPANTRIAAASSAPGLEATQNDPRLSGDEHMVNWLDCMRTRRQPNATVDVGYAHTVASIMCFHAWNTGRRQLFDATARSIRAG